MAPTSTSKEAVPSSHMLAVHRGRTPVYNHARDRKQTASPSTIFSDFCGGAVSSWNCSVSRTPSIAESKQEEQEGDRQDALEWRTEKELQDPGNGATSSNDYSRPDPSQTTQPPTCRPNRTKERVGSAVHPDGASSFLIIQDLPEHRAMGTLESRDNGDRRQWAMGTVGNSTSRLAMAYEPSSTSLIEWGDSEANHDKTGSRLYDPRRDAAISTPMDLEKLEAEASSFDNLHVRPAPCETGPEASSREEGLASGQSIPHTRSLLSPSAPLQANSSSTLYDRRQSQLRCKQENALTASDVDSCHMAGSSSSLAKRQGVLDGSPEHAAELSNINDEGSISSSQRDYIPPHSYLVTKVPYMPEDTLVTGRLYHAPGQPVGCSSGAGQGENVVSSSSPFAFSQPSKQFPVGRSAVKAASPLRIVTTTPLPPHLPSFKPPVAIHPTKSLQSPQVPQDNLETSTTTGPSSGTPSNVATPDHSPYSSLSTGRSSSIASSVPTTAASSSYITNATSCSSSDCSTSESNALQLSENPQEQGQYYVGGRTASAEARGPLSFGNQSISEARITSRYADFASSNEGGPGERFDKSSAYEGHGWFYPGNTNIRPPLLRSVSEDAPISYASPKKVSQSIARQMRHTLPDGVRGIAHQYEGVPQYDSLPMEARALTSPNFTAVDPPFPGSTQYRSQIPSAPISETSSRNASNSISSSYSSSSTAASSKRSSLYSPEALSQKLLPAPLAFFSDSRTTSKHPASSSSNSNSDSSEKVNYTISSRTRHSSSSSVGAAKPSAQTTQALHLPARARRPTANPSTASSGGPSNRLGSHDPDADINNEALMASFGPDVADAIRRAAAVVRNQSGNTHVPDMAGEMAMPTSGRGHVGHGPVSVNMSLMQNSLMGACANGYFGNAIRAKALEILEELLPVTASIVQDDDIIGIAEYGSLNSLSSSIIPSIISTMLDSTNTTETGNSPSFQVTYSDASGSDFRALMKQVDSSSPPQLEYPFHCLSPPIYSSFTTRPFPAQIVPSKSISVGISLMDLHCRRTPLSAGLSSAAAAHSELQAFLHTRAMEIKKGGLLVLAFIQRQEDEGVAAVAAGKGQRAGDKDSPEQPNFTSPIISNVTNETRPSDHVRGSAGSVEPISFPPISQTAGFASHMPTLSTSADSTTSGISFLSTSSASTSMLRRRSESSPCRPGFRAEAAVKRSDIWSTIPALLAPCIQRLVSTGLIKSDTASHLLTLPLHPRTPSQTRAVLRSVQHQWRTEWSCGLSEPGIESSGAASPSTPTPTSSNRPSQYGMPETLHEKLNVAQSNRKSPSSRQGPIREEALTLAHPAYTAVQSTALSRVQFAEHATQFVRVLYDSHFRSVLKDYAKLSRSRLEEVLDALNEVLREKLEEPSRALLSLELEVCMVALRRV